MDFNLQTRQNVGHCLIYGSEIWFGSSSTRFRWGRLPLLFRIQHVIQHDRSRANMVEQGKSCIKRTGLIIFNVPTAVYLQLRLILLPQFTRWQASCNLHLRTPESSGLHWGTTYHAWRTSLSWLKVHSWAVSGYKAAPVLGKPMSAISNLVRIKS